MRAAINQKIITAKFCIISHGEVHDTNETYPANCQKIAAVDSNKHDWD